MLNKRTKNIIKLILYRDFYYLHSFKRILITSNEKLRNLKIFRAIPKNLRNQMQNQQGQHIYSNAAMIAARSSPNAHVVRTAQLSSHLMAARSSPNGSQASIASSRGTVTFQVWILSSHFSILVIDLVVFFFVYSLHTWN